MILSLSDFRCRQPASPDENGKLLVLPGQQAAFSVPGLKRMPGSLRGLVRRILLLGALPFLLGGCAGFMPSTGPGPGTVMKSNGNGIQIVDVTNSVAGRLMERRAPQSFPEEFRNDGGPRTTVEPGDALEVMIMEAPPASLFGFGTNSTGGTSGAQAVTFPDQYISSSGIIYLPFAGEIHAAGKTIQEIEDDITSRMKAKANQPQVLVRLVGNNTDYVTVLGAVPASTHLPLTPARERLLDAIIKAGGGAASEVHPYTIRLTRGARSVTVPLDTIIRNPSQNIVLQGGDVITVMRQPYSFTVMGTMGITQEIHFEGPYITLDQAMARAGGLKDNQSSIRGIFVFRFESPDAVDWPTEPVERTASGKVRVVYHLDLSKPSSFFAAKTFPVCDGDILYAAHAPGQGLQKMLSLVGAITSPTLTGAYEGAAAANQVTP